MASVGIKEIVRAAKERSLSENENILVSSYISRIIQNAWNGIEKAESKPTKPLTENSSLNISNNLPDISKISPIPFHYNKSNKGRSSPKASPRGPRVSSPLKQARKTGGNVWPKLNGSVTESVSLSEFIVTKKTKNKKHERKSVPVKTTAMRAMSFGDSPEKACTNSSLSSTLDRFVPAELPPSSMDPLTHERQLILQIRGAQSEAKEAKKELILKEPKKETAERQIEVCSCHGCFVQTLVQTPVKVSTDGDRMIYSIVKIYVEYLKSSTKLSFITTLQSILSFFITKDNALLASVDVSLLDPDCVVNTVEDIFLLVLHVISDLPQTLLAVFTPCTTRALTRKIQMVDSSSNAALKDKLRNYTSCLAKMTSENDNSIQNQPEIHSKKYVFRHVLKPSTVDHDQLQKKENFLNTDTFAALRKQRDEIFHIFRIWQKNHSDPDWNCDLHIGSRIRCLVHSVNVSGNTTAFSRLFMLILLDSFIEQQTESSPSPDCSLNSSQLDLFKLISDFDVMTLVKEGNARKLAVLEQRFYQNSKMNMSKQATSAENQEDGSFFPGSQSFFQSFLVISGCARLHCHLLDLMFDSLGKMIDQIKHLDFDDTECPLRGAIYESRVAHLISKFCGYLYFLPYRDSHVHENLACRPYRSAPVDFCRLLKSQTDARKLLLILNVTAAFISQTQSAETTTSHVHLLEFSELKSWCHHISQTSSGSDMFAAATRHNSSVVTQALPISLYQASDVEGHRQSLPACSDSDCDLGVDEFIVLCPELARINKPRNGSLGAKVEKRRRVETKILKPQVKLDPKSLKTQLEDAFFKANPASLKRATEFVIERVTSNCVKHFRNKVIPDTLRDFNAKVKDHFNATPSDAEDDVIATAFINSIVEKCLKACLDTCLAESVPFCEKNSNEALPPILGPDVPKAAVVFALKITERDTKAKTAAWFKEKVPIIVNRDGKMAFERSRTNRIQQKTYQISNDAYKPVVRGYLSAERRNIDLLYLRLSFGGMPKFNR